MSKGKRRAISWDQGLPGGSYIHKATGPRALGHLLIEYPSFPTLAVSLKHALWPPLSSALQGPQRVSALPDIPSRAFGMQDLEASRSWIFFIFFSTSLP